MKLFSVVRRDGMIESYVALRADWRQVHVTWPWRGHRVGFGFGKEFYTLDTRREAELSVYPIAPQGPPRCATCFAALGQCDHDATSILGPITGRTA